MLQDHYSEYHINADLVSKSLYRSGKKICNTSRKNRYNSLAEQLAALRRGTCLALLFQAGSWKFLIDSRNSNKMAAVYTVHTSSIRIFICLYFPDATLETY